MARRRTVSAMIDPDTGEKIRDWGRKVWWYIVKTNEWPYSYWSGHSWGSSFRDSAAKYRTKEKAEKLAFLLVTTEFPELVGIVKVIER